MTRKGGSLPPASLRACLLAWPGLAGGREGSGHGHAPVAVAIAIAISVVSHPLSAIAIALPARPPARGPRRRPFSPLPASRCASHASCPVASVSCAPPLVFFTRSDLVPESSSLPPLLGFPTSAAGGRSSIGTGVAVTVAERLPRRVRFCREDEKGGDDDGTRCCLGFCLGKGGSENVVGRVELRRDLVVNFD